MNYFISLDMEGVAGLASWTETTEEQRELMTGEVCAAIEGIRSADAGAQILIADSHSQGRNLLLDRLPQDVQVVRGYPRPLYMVEGCDETFDGALFVGYHAPVGTRNGSMDHTYSSSAIYEVLVNGHAVGETELNMVLLARLGIPLLFGSGDDQYCAFSREYFPQAVFVTTKWACGRYAQRTLMPEAARDLIREGRLLRCAACSTMAEPTWRSSSLRVRFSRRCWQLPLPRGRCTSSRPAHAMWRPGFPGRGAAAGASFRIRPMTRWSCTASS